MENVKDQITLKSNNSTINEKCPICDDLHDTASVPYWFFLGDSDKAICEPCARYYVPVALETVRKLNKCTLQKAKCDCNDS